MKVTKAKEVLRQYAAEERNFQRLNLRGQSFKGANLSGADFSEADLRSTNFTGATLRGANFTGAKCGLQKRQALLLLLISWIIGSASGLFSMSFGVIVTGIFDSSLEEILAGWMSFTSLIITCILIMFNGIVARTLVISTFIGFLFTITDTLAALLLPEYIRYPLFGGVALFAPGLTIVVILLLAVATAIGLNISSSFTIFTIISNIFFFIFSYFYEKPYSVLAKANELDLVEQLLLAISALVMGIIISTIGIYVGLRSYKGDKKNTFINSFAIAFSSVGGTDFNGADLTEANFSGAMLKSTDFRNANLTRVRWYGAKMLDRVRPGETYLKSAQVRQWLIGEGKDKNFDGQKLQGINLEGADLSGASFIDANLSDANLHGANLTKAQLIQTQLDNTDLTEAILTGACIEDWGINSQTNFKDVISNYVFLKKKDKERIPYDENRNFQPGEFSKYVEKALNTVDLIFTDGIDWNAFLTSFKNLQDKYGSDNLGIQAIEKKPSGSFIIRVEVPPEANKAEIEKNIKAEYELKLAEIEQSYKEKLNLKDKDIDYFKQSNTDLREILKLQAQKAPSKIVNTDNYYEQKGDNNTVSNITQTHSGSGDNVAGNKNITNNYNSQDLPKAAQEIQQLLAQLSKTNPTETYKEKMTVVGEAVDRIENNPQLKTKVINALKAGGTEAFKEAVNHPLVNILLATIEGWQEEK